MLISGRITECPVPVSENMKSAEPATRLQQMEDSVAHKDCANCAIAGRAISGGKERERPLRPSAATGGTLSIRRMRKPPNIYITSIASTLRPGGVSGMWITRLISTSLRVVLLAVTIAVGAPSANLDQARRIALKKNDLTGSDMFRYSKGTRQTKSTSNSSAFTCRNSMLSPKIMLGGRRVSPNERTYAPPNHSSKRSLPAARTS